MLPIYVSGVWWEAYLVGKAGEGGAEGGRRDLGEVDGLGLAPNSENGDGGETGLGGEGQGHSQQRPRRLGHRTGSS